MLDEHYRNPKLTALYDLDSGWSIERDFYVRFAGPPTNSVLDIACGTGLIASRLAQEGHTVFGADPATAMLQVAQRRPGGDLAVWIVSTAQTLSLKRRFDRIMMTGNAFQVLLTEQDLQAALLVMQRHLATSGQIAFETRNPEIDWTSRWDYQIELKTKEGLVHEQRKLIAIHNELLQFELLYEFPDDRLRSESTLRFWKRQEIEQHLDSARLRVADVYGDWNGGPFDSQKSEEMIFIIEHNQQ